MASSTFQAGYLAASFDWTFGLRFAYKYVTAHVGNPKERRKTVASKKKGTTKLKKSKKLERTTTLKKIAGAQ
jgi:hypothetical protein